MRKFVRNLKLARILLKNDKGLPLFKNIFFNLLTSLSNKKSDKQIRLARFKKHKINPDFHLVGHSALKFKIKLVFVGFSMKVWINSMFLNRAKRICLSDFLFDKEVSKLKKMFLNNAYPSSFFDKILASFQFLTNFLKASASKIVFVYRIWVRNHINN